MMDEAAPAPALCGANRTPWIGWPSRHTAVVDLALALAALTADPARIDARAAWFAGPMAPLVLPVTVLPLAPRAERLLLEVRLPLGERVATALAWGAEAPALRAAAGQVGPLTTDARLDAALHGWAATAAGRFGLAAEGVLAAIGPDGRARQPSVDERCALADVQELLAPLAWPRWRGPLLLVPYGVDHPAIAAGQARVVRSALPVLRPPPGGRAELTVAIAELTLALSAPPPGGWPAWLASGVVGCARARGDGSGLAERALAERRAAAGAAAITEMLADSAPPEPELAKAVVGGLLHPRRRAHLPALLDLLRHGASSAGAVATAYGLTAEQLAAEPGAR